MKKRIILIAILASISKGLLASDKEDLRYVYKLFQSKEYELTIDELERFMIKYPSSEHYSAAQNILAQSYFKTGDYANAKRRYKTLVNSEFGDEAYFYLSSMALSEEDYSASEEYMLKISKGSKYRELALYRLGVKLYSIGNIEEAAKHFNRIRREKGQYEKLALYNLGLISYNKGEYFRTSVYLEEFLTKEKTDYDRLATANYMLGYSYYQVEDIDTALNYYEVVEKEYYTSEYYNQAARDMLFIYISRDNMDKIEYYANELAGSKFEELAMQSVGNYYYNKGSYEKAEEYYVKVLDKSVNTDVTYLLARTQLNLNKTEAALYNFEKLKGSKKYLNEYYYYTAYILYNNKDYEKVVKLLQSIEEKGIKEEYKGQLFNFIADSAFATSEYRTARKYYDYIYKSDKNLENLYKLFVVNGRMKDAIDVEKIYNIYNKEYPADREYRKDIYLLTGNLLVENGELVKGEKVYKDFLGKQEDETVTENLVTVLTRQGKYSELVEFLDKLELTPDNIYLKGLAYLGLGNFAEADKTFNYLINSDSIDKGTKEKATVKIIESSFSNKDYDKTLKYIDKYERSGYKLANEEVEKSKALSYFRLGKYENARNIYEKQLTNREKADFARFMIAESYYNEKNYPKAREYYKVLYSTTKDKKYAKDAAYWLIRIESFEGDYQKLQDRVQGFRTEFPNSEYEEDITYMLAGAYLIKEDNEKAIKEYEKLYAESKNPNVTEQSAKTLTELYFNTGNISKALEWNEKVNDKGFKNLWFGTIYEKANQKDKAKEYYNKIADNEEYGDKANYNLGKIYLENKEYETARKTLEKVTAYEASSVKDKAQYSIGLSYEAEGNYNRAIQSFMRIRLLYTDSTIRDLALLKVAENYEKLENKEKAVNSYRDFYNEYKNSPDYAYVVEKLLVYSINDEKIDVAKSYYKELKKIDETHAKQYEQYLGGE